MEERRERRERSACVASIVVLSYGRPEYTRATLDALARLTGPVPHEIIVVDNASRRDVQAMLHKWRRGGLVDKLVTLTTNKGTSGGYNAGFRAAAPESRYFVKLDNDIKVLTYDWLGKILAVFRDVPDAGIVATDIQNHGSLAKLPVVEVCGHRLKSWGGWVAGGGGMTFPRSLYDMLKGFREDFPAELKVMPDDFAFWKAAVAVGKAGYYAVSAQSWHQEHLDARYKAYQEWKQGQYDLLIRDVFPRVARGE